MEGTTMNVTPELRRAMAAESIDAWLVYDFRGSNSILRALLPGKRHTTRRIYLVVPREGEPRLAVSALDAGQFKECGVALDVYQGWAQLEAWLQETLRPWRRVAMEYVAGGRLPVMSIADAGTVEYIRSLGLEIASSADLVQVTAARWSAKAVKLHAQATDQCMKIKDEAFARIGELLGAKKPCFEHEIQKFIVGRFEEEGLQINDEPIVGANAHSGDPHYGPSAANPTPIKRGDFVLIDLWARRPGEENIFSDTTWVGTTAAKPSKRQQEVFDVVRRARDASVALAQKSFKDGDEVRGWQLDEAARAEIIGAGFGKYIMHRTGHSLSPGPEVHGLGMNLDNLETRDTRRMLPGLGFTVEPGIYTPEFGVRLECNVYVDPKKGPVVTCPVQEEIIVVG
jgi:Xaa-Pro aminopeptidase